MKAIVCTRYGAPDVLELRDVEKPVPGDGDVLIKIHATTVTRADTMMRQGTPFYARLFLGLLRPKHSIPGTGFAGEIAATGSEVKEWKPGDRVFGETGVNFGAYAEYLRMPGDGLLAALPRNLTFEEAAPVCDGLLTAMNFLKNIARLESGQKILINGAAGGIGSAAVQLARQYGADVTGVCSAANAGLAASLGAGRVIDYAKEDFASAGGTYDVIFDTVGKSSFSACRAALSPKGLYISPVLGLPLLLHMLRTRNSAGKKANFSATGLLPVPGLRLLLNEARELLEAGSLRTIIDGRYPLERIPEAHRYVDAGHKKGNIVISVIQDGPPAQ